MIIWFLVYILLCLIVGSAGSKQPIGFYGYTLLALFLSPFIALVILLVFSVYSKAAIKKHIAENEIKQD